MDIVALISCFGLAWAWSHLAGFCAVLVDADGGMLFAFWGRMLERWATGGEQSGQAWRGWIAKPLGLCPYCFTTWLAIFGAVYSWSLFGGSLPVHLAVFVGLNWRGQAG